MAPPRKAPAKKTAAKRAPAKKTAAKKTADPRDLPLRDVVLRSAGQLQELIGRSPEGVVAVEQDDDEWKVQVEVVESHRIPETTDILAVYELVAARNGELLSYRRLNRYVRGRFEE